MGMVRLSRDDILKMEDVVTEEVEVPEWGGSVLVRAMSGQQRDEFEASILERRGKRMIPNTANIRARLVAWCVVDDDGKRLFTNADVDELGKHSASALSKVYDVASRLSGVSDEDVEELAENFGKTGSATSSSASAKTSEKASQNSSH